MARQTVGMVRCEHCGLWRRDLGGPHAPRWNDARELVDCIGRMVEP